MADELPSASSRPMSSKTKTIGVIHQSLRSHKKLKRSFKKSMRCNESNFKGQKYGKMLEADNRVQMDIDSALFDALLAIREPRNHTPTQSLSRKLDELKCDRGDQDRRP